MDTHHNEVETRMFNVTLMSSQLLTEQNTTQDRDAENITTKQREKAGDDNAGVEISGGSKVNDCAEHAFPVFFVMMTRKTAPMSRVAHPLHWLFIKLLDYKAV